MLRILLASCAGLALLLTQAFAGTQYIGVVSMYICDNGEDLCSNTLMSSPVDLSTGPFTEDFVFDFVNDFPHVPDDVPLLKATAQLGTPNGADFSSASIMLYNSSQEPLLGFNTPFVPNESGYYAQAEALIFPETGYYVQVSGIANAAFPLQVSVSAFDLGPIIAPEPSTWAMMLLGMAGLGFVRYRASRKPA